MTAEEYLRRIRKIDALLINKVEEYERCVGMAQGLGDMSVAERVKSSRNLQQIPNAIAKYIDIEREIEDLRNERESIIRTIEKLPLTEYNVVYSIYVAGLTHKEIAFKYDRSYEWVKIWKRKALERIEEFISE